MTSIKLTVSGASAMAEVDGLLTSGMVGIPVTIVCDGAWGGLTKSMVCRAGHIVKTILNIGNTATVAHECMVPNQTLFIGIEGRNADGTLVIPTVWARCGLICSGANADADPSADPTLPVWAQIESKIGNLDDLETTAKENLVAAINEALSNGGGEADPEAVQKIVDAYLAENPPAPGADGKDGVDGITPTIGDNGNWYLGDTDTGKPSRGETGAPGAAGQQGEKGDKGDTGPQGPRGEKGDTGPQGEQGAQGPAGSDGKSAYQYAVEGGYTGTESEFVAKLAEELPTTLPNPNALTFTGAVTGSYDGSAPLSVEIPSGGGGGGSSSMQETVLASGVVASGTAQWHKENTGLTVADLQEWKLWGFVCLASSQKTAFGILFGNKSIFKISSTGCKAILSWFDDDHNAINIVDILSQDGFINIDKSFFGLGSASGLTRYGLQGGYIPYVENANDTVYIYTHDALTEDVAFKIVGLIK